MIDHVLHKCFQANINNVICNSNSEKLFELTVDSKLKFDDYVNNLCDKASQKLFALARVSHLMSRDQKQRIMKAFITSQFGYCPLVWMFCSRSANNRINRIHERPLRVTYNDDKSSFVELLDKDNSVLIHHRNLQLICTEIYKIKHNLSSEILKKVFNIINPKFNLRRRTLFESRNIRTEQYGFHSLSYIGPKNWYDVPENIKSSETLDVFKNSIKEWKPVSCHVDYARNIYETWDIFSFFDKTNFQKNFLGRLFLKEIYRVLSKISQNDMFRDLIFSNNLSRSN